MYDSDAELASDNRVSGGMDVLCYCCGREHSMSPFSGLEALLSAHIPPLPLPLTPSSKQVILPQNMAGVGNLQSKQSAVRLTGMHLRPPSRLESLGRRSLLAFPFSLTSVLILPCPSISIIYAPRVGTADEALAPED